MNLHTYVFVLTLQSRATRAKFVLWLFCQWMSDDTFLHALHITFVVLDCLPIICLHGIYVVVSKAPMSSKLLLLELSRLGV